MEKNDAMKELYWECNYNLAYCIYQEAKILKNPESQKKGIERAAGIILEARRSRFGTPTQAARFNELLNTPKYADLKAALDRLDGGSVPSGKSP